MIEWAATPPKACGAGQGCQEPAEIRLTLTVPAGPRGSLTSNAAELCMGHAERRLTEVGQHMVRTCRAAGGRVLVAGVTWMEGGE